MVKNIFKWIVLITNLHKTQQLRVVVPNINQLLPKNPQAVVVWWHWILPLFDINGIFSLYNFANFIQKTLETIKFRLFEHLIEASSTIQYHNTMILYQLKKCKNFAIQIFFLFEFLFLIVWTKLVFHRLMINFEQKNWAWLFL